MAIQYASENADTRPSKRGKAKTGIRWWTAPKESVAREMFRWIVSNEIYSWPRRYQHLLAFRYMTGRPTNPAFHYSVGARPGAITAWYGRSVWSPPAFNAMAQADDVLANRVYKSRPFLQVCPIAGDFKARVKAKKLSRWIDAEFYDLKLWPTIEQCGADSRMYGTAYIKIDVQGKYVCATRILDDEVVLDEGEANLTDCPKTLGIRLFMHRETLLDLYGTTEEARNAINTAPSANLGIYFGADLDVSDIVVLAEAWHLPGESTKGRHVLAINNYALCDEEYDLDHYPLAKLVYKQMSSGWRGQGLAEQVMSLQREIERVMSAFWENVKRMSWPRVGIEAGSNVNESALVGKSGGTFRYTKTPPTFFTPEAITKDQFQYLSTLIKMVRERVGISDQAASGEKPTGLNSGLAIEKQAMIDDGRHVELMLHLQDFVEQIGVLLVEAGEKCKPAVRLPGRTMQQIKWDDVQFSENSYSLRAFPMSNMPQTIAGRQQYIDTMFAQGSISRATKLRLEQIPDIDGFQDLTNASLDAIEYSLDEMVEEGEYCAPEPWADLTAALSTTQSRYLFEKQQKTPQDRLDLLLRYMSAVSELIQDAGLPAPPGFGMQPPAAAPGVADASVMLPRPDIALPQGGVQTPPVPLPQSVPVPSSAPG